MDFATKMQAMVAAEMTASHNDAERAGAAVEAMVAATAFTIALAGRGEAAAMSKLLDGAEAYLHESAAGYAKMAKFMAAPFTWKE